MPNDTRELIKRFNIRLTKSLGQNFLIDETMPARIVDAAMADGMDLVIEIGPGIGSMTRELAIKAGRVVAVEIDKHLMEALTQNLKEFSNVKIINDDVMKLDIREMVRQESENRGYGAGRLKVKVVANLPYYITTPIIMKFLEENPGIDIMVFMVQKEVAERMAAKPGGKDYGALSVAVQYYSEPEILFNVPPHCFMPQPEVESTVVRMIVRKAPPVEVNSKSIFFRTVKAAFGQRRKTLVNALSNSGYFIESKEEIKNILKNMGIDEMRRGETLNIMQFAELSNAFSIKNC